MFKLPLSLAFATAIAFQASAQSAEDGPGPNLEIELGGSVTGTVVIDLLPDVAPKHVEQITGLAEEGAYNDVVFHRVIGGFMAQTGDVEFGRRDGNIARAGTGDSSRPDLPAEFSDVSFERGVVGMARTSNPNSANSQFFIMFEPAGHLDGQYTVVGRVVEGMDYIDQLATGEPPANPDYMKSVKVVPNAVN